MHLLVIPIEVVGGQIGKQAAVKEDTFQADFVVGRGFLVEGSIWASDLNHVEGAGLETSAYQGVGLNIGN